MEYGPSVYIISITLIKLLAGLLFLIAYLRTRRFSTLLISFAWFLSIPVATFGAVDIRVENAMISLAYAFTLLAVFRLIQEERIISLPKSITIAVPLALAVTGVGTSLIKSIPDEGYLIDGIFEFIAGLIVIESLSAYYKRNAKGLGISLALSGIMSTLYPMFYQKPPNMLITSIAAWLIIVPQFWFYSKIIYSERFFKWPQSMETSALKIEGTHIIPPSEFEDVKDKVGLYPTLAFLRNFKPFPGWISYLLSTVEMPKALYPTDLYKITEISTKYFKEAQQKGTKGIAIIEGLEFLKLYNDFDAVAKMLSNVRDCATLNNGTLIVFAEESAWDKKEWATLRRILGEE
ncbi:MULTISPECIES: DUF835 domain-containing protein [Thermococcus]|uniref:DUF835 domain-containing protein n=2 Tax=Thermococcus sibiricus TaxID=172049 RepID=C6A288_THESM|nr:MULTISPECIES: DUF835 domain-containing protein [Thermococcus]KUK28275.1 MAG: Uncharacterized protein XD61_1190 [Thermococcus sp. 40_45]HII67234.1 DUF835 domain-containing protein [Thermococcaceae archaeon]ACS89733.1 hypothetical protein TSIB_0668 [Thermococcus sibiricus MM 739]KUK17060.1 MAG: Uncharacterized protein XD54_1665 [Thermococcus sibiricus]MBC7094347.1 DUF835 domain-containing protein [Thermococcus sp.]